MPWRSLVLVGAVLAAPSAVGAQMLTPDHARGSPYWVGAGLGRAYSFDREDGRTVAYLTVGRSVTGPLGMGGDIVRWDGQTVIAGVTRLQEPGSPTFYKAGVGLAVEDHCFIDASGRPAPGGSATSCSRPRSAAFLVGAGLQFLPTASFTLQFMRMGTGRLDSEMVLMLGLVL